MTDQELQRISALAFPEKCDSWPCDGCHVEPTKFKEAIFLLLVEVQRLRNETELCPHGRPRCAAKLYCPFCDGEEAENIDPTKESLCRQCGYTHLGWISCYGAAKQRWEKERGEPFWPRAPWEAGP